MELIHKNLNGIDFLYKKAQEGLPTVMLLHGYGANMQDLSSLADAMNIEGIGWLFPNGVLSLDGGMGRSWFPIDEVALQQAMMQGGHRDLRELKPPALFTSRDAIKKLLLDLDLKLSEMIVGGFSQGAMLSCELTFNSEDIPRGLIILSGALINKTNWQLNLEKFKSQNKSIQFFQSHGSQDPLLEYKQALELNQLLLDSKHQGKIWPFNGGHEIPMAIVEQLQIFLAKHCK